MTGFFYIPSAFAALEEHVIPELFEGKGPHDTLRIWVAGCGTGEEAYSAAILLHEFALRHGGSPDIHIYATDNNEKALAIARRGLYPRRIESEMSPSCLQRYFAPEGDNFRVIPEVRVAIQFSTHTSLFDSNVRPLDLIICRQLLDDLETMRKAQIVSFFERSLLEGGYLFLGNATSAKELLDEFELVNSNHHIYRLNALPNVESEEEDAPSPGLVVHEFSEEEEEVSPGMLVHETVPELDVTNEITDTSTSVDLSEKEESISDVLSRDSIVESVTSPDGVVGEIPDEEAVEILDKPLPLEEDGRIDFNDPDLLSESSGDALPDSTSPSAGPSIETAHPADPIQEMLQQHGLHVEEQAKQVDTLVVSYDEKNSSDPGPGELIDRSHESENGHIEKNAQERVGGDPHQVLQLGQLIHLSPNPMALHNESGHLLVVSDAWVRLGGLAIKDASTIEEWKQKLNSKNLTIQDAIRRKDYEKRGAQPLVIKPNGETRHVALIRAPAGSNDTGEQLYITMVEDLTERKTNQIRDKLTAYRQGQDAAAKRTFLANMSHEIRTPLTSMIGFAEYLTNRLNGQDVQFADYIIDSGHRLLETLNAILRVASLEGYEETLRLEMLEITQEVQSVMQVFKPQAEQHSISLRLIVEEPVKARLDRVALRRIISNILGNAIKYTGNGGEVTLNVSGNGSFVEIDIEDNGIGITKEFLPYIFERFSQESRGDGRSYEGAGLGLAIAKQLVELMSGVIEVETAPQAGSKFTIRLPRDLGKLQLDSGRTPEVLPENRPKILIVEDNVDAQELMLIILQDKYDACIAPNASEALLKAKDQVYDVIFMDLSLGGDKTGFDVVRELRQDPRHNNTPILAVSALPIGTIRKLLIQEGFDGYIAKPFTKDRVLDALKNLLANG